MRPAHWTSPTGCSRAPRDLPAFRYLRGEGEQWGLSITYAEQPRLEGLARAYVIWADFVGSPPSARVFAYHANDPERYGVVSFDAGEFVRVRETRQSFKVASLRKSPFSRALPGLSNWSGRVIGWVSPIKRGISGACSKADAPVPAHRRFRARGRPAPACHGRHTPAAPQAGLAAPQAYAPGGGADRRRQTGRFSLRLRTGSIAATPSS
ncbi:hypothetical protein MTR62_04350 [Novosphingobium sp. 1949]|uniref:Uncharacterized protein n=1 Tax=Novosphingobium organovorum TaxID=2930092 RepID=A0ABT0BAT9_9SPHN|nr:hypothetical protein [Novosphingobium organovorum]